jgi:hypothetical protein
MSWVVIFDSMRRMLAIPLVSHLPKKAMPSMKLRTAFVASVLLATLAAPSQAATRTEQQYTQLISRNQAGGIPNGPSGNSVISGDKRYARAIAFESDASDLVSGDTNGQRDVFAVLREGVFSGDGSKWNPGPTVLISRTASGAPANGPSFAPSIDGAFQDAETKGPTCVGFLSAASNIVNGDTNGHVDAFLTRIIGGKPKLISPAVPADTTAVAVSGDCSRVAMITAGKLYLYDGHVTRLIPTTGAASDPSFSTGRNQDLVYSTPSGAWLLSQGSVKATLVAPGGQNPSYNDVKRQVVAYEASAGGHTQIMFRDLGKPPHTASALFGNFGDGDSVKPVIGNAGFAIAFETTASNLGVNSLKRVGDDNGQPDIYIYTDTRHLTLLESVKDKAVAIPGGGTNPGMNFYNNYITFDSPAPLGAATGPKQVFMRYLGAVTNDTAQQESLATPLQGETAGVIPTGHVTIRLPAGASPKFAKRIGLTGAATAFIPLNHPRDVPIGSTLDTTRGRVGLFTSSGLGLPLNEGNFRGGRFQLAQGHKNPLTTLSMTGGSLGNCATRVPRGGAAKPIVTEAKRKRRLFSSVHGHFRSRGRNSSATVRGTQWSMTDTCAGTLTSVQRGVVVVRDFRLRKNHKVRAGHRYFARAKHK